MTGPDELDDTHEDAIEKRAELTAAELNQALEDDDELGPVEDDDQLRQLHDPQAEEW